MVAALEVCIKGWNRLQDGNIILLKTRVICHSGLKVKTRRQKDSKYFKGAEFVLLTAQLITSNGG
jgi:hypothetical protein